jgi:hypothetical protein
MSCGAVGFPPGRRITAASICGPNVPPPDGMSIALSFLGIHPHLMHKTKVWNHQLMMCARHFHRFFTTLEKYTGSAELFA